MTPSEPLPLLRFQDPAPGDAAPIAGDAAPTTEATTGAPTEGGGTTETTPTSPLSGFLPILLIGGLFWLMIIRPQMKEQKRRKELLSELKKGDEVMTTGGLFGTIEKLDEARVTLKIADGVKVVYSRAAVQGRVADMLADEKPDKK